MKHAGWMAAVVVVAGVTLNAAWGDKPNVSGTWVMDKERSFSNAPGLEQTLVLTHTGDEVKVEATMKTTAAPAEQKVNEVWTLDGQERPFQPARPNSNGVRKASWMPGDRGILIVDDITITTPKVETKDVVTPALETKQLVTRKVVLSADGKTLTIDYYVDTTPGYSGESKRVFAKQ